MWKDHAVTRLNPEGEPVELPAQSQIVTESWNRVVAVPHIVYMPEVDRVLMLASCDYPGGPWVHYAMVLFSDDAGATWSTPRYVHTDAQGNPACGLGHALTYLGEGRVMMYSCHPPSRWFSSDFGETWGDTVPVEPAPGGRTWMAWDPVLVDRDPGTGRMTRLMETGYWGDSATMDSQAYVRFSTDGGRTWTGAHHVPEFEGVNEVCPVRATNGDIVATCRTDPPDAYKDVRFDHYEGFGISISRDDGYTWSEVSQLYDWGRHHASTALLPCGYIVATYVVRLGYSDTADGFPRFGIEAVVSRDNGRTWDLDRRYILAAWTGNRKSSPSPIGKLRSGGWHASPHTTSSVVLPDGSILTAYGTGYRQKEDAFGPGLYGPRDVGLVNWNIGLD
ncbi:MAG: sialidase family protein [Gemmatimonadota bacterium]|nr:sialidase family protein [Gemmatimonadota bacterium]